MRREIADLQRALESDQRNPELLALLAREMVRVNWTFQDKTIEAWVDQLVGIDYEKAHEALEALEKIGPGALPLVFSRVRESPIYSAAALAQLMPYSEQRTLELLFSDDPISQDIAFNTFYSARYCPAKAIPALLALSRKSRSVKAEKVTTLLLECPESTRQSSSDIIALIFAPEWADLCIALRLLPELQLKSFERFFVALAINSLAPPRRMSSTYYSIAKLLISPEPIAADLSGVSLDTEVDVVKATTQLIQHARELLEPSSLSVVKSQRQARFADALNAYGESCLKQAMEFCAQFEPEYGIKTAHEPEKN